MSISISFTRASYSHIYEPSPACIKLPSSWKETPKRRYDTEPSKKDAKLWPEYMSSRSRNKIRNKSIAFYNASRLNKRKVRFLTLQFESHVQHRKAQQMLNAFFSYLRTYGEFSYIWVAELQHENNNRIHFHILLDSDIIATDVQKVNDAWRRIHRKYNADYKGKTNPLQSRHINTFSNLTYYLTKYMSKKNNENTTSNYLEIRNWYCSRSVSCLITECVVPCQDTKSIIEQIEQRNYITTKKHQKLIKPTPIQTDNAIVLPFVHSYFQSSFLHHINHINAQILSVMYSSKDSIYDCINYYIEQTADKKLFFDISGSFPKICIQQ